MNNKPRKSEYADAGLKPHGHRYPEYDFAYSRKQLEVIKRENKFIQVERIYCVFDGCGKYKEKVLSTKVCQSCGRVK